MPKRRSSVPDHGEVALTLDQGIDEAHSFMDRLREAGVDYDDVIATLEREGVEKFRGLVPRAARGDRGQAGRDGDGLSIELVEEIVAIRGREVLLRRAAGSGRLATQEAYEHNEFLPYWPSCGRRRASSPRRWRGDRCAARRVVELGCGLGLPSIVSALSGGRVLATDWAEDALAVVAGNAELNGVHVDTALVDWAEPDDLIAAVRSTSCWPPDVLYENRDLDPVLSLLGRLGSEAWISDPDAHGWTVHGRREARLDIEATGACTTCAAARYRHERGRHPAGVNPMAVRGFGAAADA